MTKALDIVNRAKGEIGVKENPPGSNNVKYNTDYYGVAVNGSWYPWCCAFIWWLFKEEGALQLFNDGVKTAYCPTVENWGRQKNLFVDKDKGLPGDIVLFDFSGKGVSEHIGIIEKVLSDGSYYVIEGNTSVSSNDNGGNVMRRRRYYNVIRKIIRPKYEDAKPIVKGENTVNVELLVLRKGTVSPQVKTLQRLLSALGYKDKNGKALTIDGDFGSNTDFALRNFQKAKALEVDGICGKNSWNALLK